jgi:hypothetical protein
MIYNQKDKQYNGQKKKDQGTNNDLQTGINRYNIDRTEVKFIIKKKTKQNKKQSTIQE